MSPIFRHGRLRLYLLKLLDEAPRHGYEVIRLLQDRFMGVYSPSPGTIYPRLARLEDDGLVTHDEVNGKKVYRITDKGREEIHSRLDELADLEDELTQSVRDIAREVSEDVRDTVRSLREEITWAARGGRDRSGRDADSREAGTADLAAGTNGAGAPGAGAAGTGAAGTGVAGTGVAGTGVAGEAAAADGTARDDTAAGTGASPQDDAQRIRDEARQAREDMRDAFRSRRARGHPGPHRTTRTDGTDAGRGGRGRGDWMHGDWGRGDRSRGDWAKQDWGSWASRAAGFQDWGMQGGLDRLASDFARDLSSAAGHVGDLGESALGDLKNILADALTRIRDEVLAPHEAAGTRDAQDPPADEHPDTEPGEHTDTKPPGS